MGGDDGDMLDGLNSQILGVNRGQARTQDLPFLTAVDGDIDAAVGADVKDVFIGGIFLDDVGDAAGDAAGDIGPGLAVIGGLEDVAVEVVNSFTVNYDINGCFVKSRGVDGGDTVIRGQARRDIGPGLTFVLGDLDQTVVGTGVDEAFSDGRFIDGENGGVSDVALFGRIVVGQVGTDSFPTFTLVVSQEDELGAVEESFIIVG